jgi:DNA polymerase-3 subunit epsilon
MNVTAIDFETANQSPASICALGVSVLEDGAIEQRYESLIRPHPSAGRFLPGNIRIHGIRPQDVADAPEWPEVYAAVVGSLEDGSMITAHNAGFDIGCLKAACELYGMPVPHLRYFDTVELSRKVFPRMEHHRLDNMCDYLGVELDHHRAGSDAYGCLMIVVKVMTITGIYEIEDLLEQCNTRIFEL